MADIELFRRKAIVTIDTLQITGLRTFFRVEKTLKPDPNTCELRIWNLTEDHRAALEELRPAKDAPRGIPVQIEAGYEQGTSLVWLGDVRTVDSDRQVPDWVTVLTSGDGEKAVRSKRLGLSFGPKTDVATVLRAMVRELGLGEGNLSQVASSLELKGKGTVFASGITLTGPVAKRLTDFARSADLEWSIQDGAIQFVHRGKTLGGQAIRLTSDTGLIGSPTVDADGTLTASMLMIPDVRPGRLVVVDSARVKGNYKIQKARWEGDTYAAGSPWQITIEAKRF